MGIARLAYGGVYSSGTNPQAACYLYNDSSKGDYLAVYGILGYHAATPQLMGAAIIKLRDNGAPGNVAMLVPGTGQINGLITVNGAVGVFQGNQNPVIFKGDGSLFLTNGDVPLFVVPPGYSLVVGAWQILGSAPTNDPTSCSFVWGIYSGPVPPQLPAA